MNLAVSPLRSDQTVRSSTSWGSYTLQASVANDEAVSRTATRSGALAPPEAVLDDRVTRSVWLSGYSTFVRASIKVSDSR